MRLAAIRLLLCFNGLHRSPQSPLNDDVRTGFLQNYAASSLYNDYGEDNPASFSDQIRKNRERHAHK